MYVRADKLSNPPENYTEFNLVDLEKYPYVKEAAMNPGNYIKVPSGHHQNISEFGKITSNYKTNYIKVNNEYYEYVMNLLINQYTLFKVQNQRRKFRFWDKLKKN
ncbi:MAG: hypothetical protein PHF18_12560 [Methanosarcina sp.]|uniref:hypothetical protein n=1 Tax=Methanosarcina sp. TaxID=2213 RepID=UPI00262FC872|nr:hypothetical protein [Methanosarcina sp.]MDD3247666.1 hypothetical protein [Methanosarcina sp.]